MDFEELRDYQKNCVEELRAGIKNGHRSQLLVAPTGAGKTVIAAHLLGEAYEKSSSSFFVCDRVSLVDQTSATLDRYGIQHGVIQASHWRYRPWEPIQVVSAQTLARRKLEAPKLLLWDECFTENSIVNTVGGMKPIQLVRSGELVYNAVGIGKVLGVSSKPAGKRKIVTVRFEDGTKIRCTEEHRFFTTESWIQAGKLAGKSVIRIQDMRSLWGDISPKVLRSKKRVNNVSGSKKLEWTKDLHKVLCKEIEESDALKIIAPKNVNDLKKNWSQTKSAWWKRNGAIAAAAENVGKAWCRLGARACGELRKGGKSKGLIYSLQNRHSKSIKDDSNRIGRKQPFNNDKARARCEKNKVSCGIRVVSVQIEERQSNEVVYNLHISGHPSYFVDGKLVHNCHTCYKTVVEYCKDKSIKVIGLTATPFTKGMGEIFTNVVNSTTTNKLIDQGWLVPLKPYAAKEIDMTGAKIIAGEWDEHEIERRGLKIVGDVVAEWEDKTFAHFNKPEKTIVFSATVAHGDELCRQFQARGYNFQQISYKDGNSDRRRALIEEFRRPDSEIVGLISCEALAKGFDVTDIKIGVGARPYRKSLSGHIQQLGRVMRSHPGKEFAVWLDHSGNILRFMEDTQDVFEYGVKDLKDGVTLDSTVRKEKTEKEKKDRKCHSCGFVHYKKICPACGAERIERQTTIDTASGKMLEIDMRGKKPKKPEWMQDKAKVWKEVCLISNDIKKGKRFDAERFALAQYRQMYGVWPQTTFHLDGAVTPTLEVRNQIRKNIIAYSHRMARRSA